MGDRNTDQGHRQREDILVSVCLSDLSASDGACASVRDLAQQLSSSYRFYEIILVVEERVQEKYGHLLGDLKELRLFSVRPGQSFYRRRVIAAEEAIGDVVLVASADELPCLDIIAMIERAAREPGIAIASPDRRRSHFPRLSNPLAVLGRLSGFYINLDDFQTKALTRTTLNRVLSHEDPELALRFPPSDSGFLLSVMPVTKTAPARGSLSRMKRRALLLQKLLVYLSPRLLQLVALSSALLVLLGIAYAGYAISVQFLVEDVAAGWFTTSAMLSLSAMFMGLSILGVSLGLQLLLQQNRNRRPEDLAREISRVDVFGKVASDLNVQLQQGADVLREQDA